MDSRRAWSHGGSALETAAQGSLHSAALRGLRHWARPRSYSDQARPQTLPLLGSWVFTQHVPMVQGGGPRHWTWHPSGLLCTSCTLGCGYPAVPGGRTCLTPPGHEFRFESLTQIPNPGPMGLLFCRDPFQVQGGPETQPTTRPDFPGPEQACVSHLAVPPPAQLCVCVHVCACHVHACEHLCVCVYACVCMHVSMCVCVRVYVYRCPNHGGFPEDQPLEVLCPVSSCHYNYIFGASWEQIFT